MRVELLDNESFLNNIDSKDKWNLFKQEYIKTYFINKNKCYKDIDSNNMLDILTDNNTIKDKNMLDSEMQIYFSFIANFIIQRFSDIDLYSNLFVEFMIISNNSMQELNKQYMKKDYATDVLSFPLEIYNIQEIQCIGSIVINMDEVYSKSNTYKHSIYAELSLLFIHALLHILGFDHENDNGEHRQLEKNIIEEFNLPNSLIERTIN